VLVFEQIGQPAGNDPGFSGTGAGENEQRPFGMLDGLTLLWIQIIQSGHGNVIRKA
jgi:hypothetical protein